MGPTRPCCTSWIRGSARDETPSRLPRQSRKRDEWKWYCWRRQRRVCRCVSSTEAAVVEPARDSLPFELMSDGDRRRRKCRLRRLSARDETRDRLRANLVGDLIPECGVATGSVRRFPEDLLVATMFVPEPARRVQCVQRCGRRGDKQHCIDFEGTLVIGPVSSTTRRARLQVGYLSTVGEDRQKQLHLWGLLRCLTTARSVWHLCSCIKLRSMNTTVKRSSMRC